MRDVDLALSQISNIRAQVAASTRFQGIAPGFSLLSGVLAFIVATIQSVQPQALVQESLGFIAVWAGVLVISSCIVAFEATSRVRRLHGRMSHAMLSTALQKVLPFAIAAAVITWAVCTFSLESAWLLPGLWLMLIGLLGFSALANLPREMGWPAIWYFVCGAVVLALAGASGALSPWMMGIPMSVGQVIVTLILSRASRECSTNE